MVRFSRKTFATLTLAFLAAIAMIFSETFMASAHVASRSTTAIHVSSTPVSGPSNIDTNDQNAPPPSKDHIIYVTSSSKTVSPNLVINCGYVTCSLYFSRYQTTEIAIWGPALVIAEGIIPGAVGFILKLGAQFVQARAQVASSFNACLRVRFAPPAVPIGLYVDHSKFCHDH